MKTPINKIVHYYSSLRKKISKGRRLNDEMTGRYFGLFGECESVDSTLLCAACSRLDSTHDDDR